MFDNIQENKTFKNLYNGEWIVSKSGNTIDIYSPNDNSCIGKVQAFEKEEVNKTIENSRQSQKLWADTPINERASILHKTAELLEDNLEELSQLLQMEIAKDKESSASEIRRTADFIRFTADEGKHMEGETIFPDNFPGYKRDRVSIVNRIPIGVVLAISPFNYPINLSASKLAPALIAGNSVILKPPTQGALSALHLAEIFNRAGLPSGVLNTVTGKSSEIGDYIVSHEDINFINFTGSTEVGKHIAKVAGKVPMLMELGGKDAAIVLEDADVGEAAKQIVAGAYSYSGQRCTAVKRVLAVDKIADTLIAEMNCLISKLKVGSPLEGAQITPLINNEAANFVQELIDDAISKGAKLIIGNKRNNNLMYPSLFDYVTTDMRLAWEEPFGPILPVIRVKNTNEAIQISNASQYGLQASVFTSSIKDAFYIANKLEVGTVHINSKTERGPDHFPFLGVKASGMGTQGIRYSIEAMSRPKSVVLNIN
ncbi:NADP-dependent glyceraldehyde-3-phosphate dehydrogenase [Clostridium swellfunianum]|uniref:NADP-dependent glyceraldehyde-3-phosphate dehydrogenase n=1 Tax=Clostridium swellfunianum TaxID=1367462 RepID=UPI00202FD0BF|nr:NADP-dependent glyceraldehyde-3-phosphate dehydrogenase [Clostridium swellfunianum]MCM0650715.1 NADP-dependent glyceraldehyde-3-phosphate dehydrogenase [Clostridium swellfunianum]